MQNAFFRTPYGVGIGGASPPFSYKEYRKNQEMGEESAKIASQCRKFVEGLLKTQCF